MDRDLRVVRPNGGYNLQEVPGPVGPQVQNLVDVLVAVRHHQRVIDRVLDVLIRDPVLPRRREDLHPYYRIAKISPGARPAGPAPKSRSREAIDELPEGGRCGGAARRASTNACGALSARS